ncbi:MAG: SDR family NAD(P)-dependent oxidoreductase [Oscillospiraceae bacterium]|jgi:NAD(P)-dependent dehydrogenase (short-subunit alcohol dehydrogenase family)|nr:SDR family NAD(P)-dependent oxidoreductase [Oscillospiraceae bacterium]
MSSPKTILLTGASDGIGAAAARLLTPNGHRLVLVGRSPDKTRRVAEAVGADTYFTADYEKLDEVRALADKLRAACPRIDVLANNAGGMFHGPALTGDGFERTFQVNHLAGFLLTSLLMDVLLTSGATVVNTSSVGARLYGHIDMDDLGHLKAFTPRGAYGDSKLANILFTRELHRRYRAQGLAAVAFHPGVVATNFAADTSSLFRVGYHSFLKVFLATPEQGGTRLAYFAQGVPDRDWASGGYYDKPGKAGREKPQAHDEALAGALWARSAEMVGL